MTSTQDDLTKAIREIITSIRNLKPSLGRIKSSTASDQEVALKRCLLIINNDHSAIFGSPQSTEETLLYSKYFFVDNVRHVLAMALERSDVSATRKLDALRSGIDFAEVFDDIELDSWGTCSLDDAYKLAMSAFSVAMAIIGL
jgi:hypothetical protein